MKGGRLVSTVLRKDELLEELRRLRMEVEEERAARAKRDEDIRTRMIFEANLRGWCSDFDAILVEFGMNPRDGFLPEAQVSNDHAVRVTVVADFKVSVIARNAIHANRLVQNSVCRMVGATLAIGEHEAKILAVDTSSPAS